MLEKVCALAARCQQCRRRFKRSCGTHCCSLAAARPVRKSYSSPPPTALERTRTRTDLATIMAPKALLQHCALLTDRHVEAPRAFQTLRPLPPFRRKSPISPCTSLRAADSPQGRGRQSPSSPPPTALRPSLGQCMACPTRWCRCGTQAPRAPAIPVPLPRSRSLQRPAGPPRLPRFPGQGDAHQSCAPWLGPPAAAGAPGAGLRCWGC